ncbi:lipid-A-disaccharide synthase [soil metagenome]
MKYYLIAGEASGDLHGSNLIKEVRKYDPAADFRIWGGDMMQTAGGTLVKHYKDLAFMGFIEVVKNLPAIFRNLKFAKEDIKNYKPDVLVLIDYPGFNLRMAKWAKENNIKVVFYISPQVWAWKASRVNQIKKYVDKMLVILPFEKQFYKQREYNVEYVGHPLVEVISNFKQEAAGISAHTHSIKKTESNIIALLPGSRKQELKTKLPIMLEVAKYFPSYQFIVAKAPGVDDAFYSSFLSSYKNVNSVSGKTYDLLLNADAALVTSGTATLETALFGVPQVVCYKGSEISYQIAKRIISIKYISLVNLIMDKQVVRELIQNDLTVENLRNELHKILSDEVYIKRMKDDYDELKKLLTAGGNASENAAKIIIEFTSSAA